ncbi:MAG: AEC family transporter, partial [Anaerolineales bacterium]
LVLGLDGLTRQVGVIEASMPSAVLTIVLATEYDVEPTFVSAAVFTSTLASAFTLTPLLAILKG